jgi:hypothetical protein
VVATVAQTAAPVVESVVTVVDDTLAPVVATAVPVVSNAGKTVASTTAPITRTGSSARTTVAASVATDQATLPVAPNGAATATVPSDDQVPASGSAAQVGAGGAPPAWPRLAGMTIIAPFPVSGVEATPTYPPEPPPAVEPPPASAASTTASAAAASPSSPIGPRDLGLAFLGGLLAVGVVLLSTSSAGTGGHAPSSTAVTTRPYRLVAPALRWRVRALAECVRPAPLLAPLELPG